MNQLAIKAIVGFSQLILVLGIILFVPPWTLGFWQGWLFLGIFAASSAAISFYLWWKDPQLLERRVRAGPGAEKEKRQQLIQALAAAAFIATILVPSLDRRFGWSAVPIPLEITGDVLVAAGFLLVFFVFRENTYTAATIEVSAGQSVVSSGPYAFVRHPMYAGALVFLFGTPLALGSWWGLFTFVPMAAVIVWRLLAEEDSLAKSLPGYTEYCRQVRYRLIPGVW